ncbi:MAG TPA: hypothetical protein VJ830_08395 [Anaerolineales bacterium]|nr:hypothetical protein [Anaerolineales bacterium]
MPVIETVVKAFTGKQRRSRLEFMTKKSLGSVDRHGNARYSMDWSLPVTESVF